MPRCRHWAVKLHRRHGLSISSWSAVPLPVHAVLDEAEWMDGHILPYCHATPLEVTTFPQEREQTWPRGSKGRRKYMPNTWALASLPVVVQSNSPASATQEDPWKPKRVRNAGYSWPSPQKGHHRQALKAANFCSEGKQTAKFGVNTQAAIIEPGLTSE